MTHESANPTEIVGVTFMQQVLSMISNLDWTAIFTKRSRKGRKKILYHFLNGNSLCIGFILLYGTNKESTEPYESFVEGGTRRDSMQFPLTVMGWNACVLLSIFPLQCVTQWYRYEPNVRFDPVQAEIVPLARIRLFQALLFKITTDFNCQHMGQIRLFGRLASTMQGSSPATTFYILWYFGAVGIRKMVMH